MNENSFRKKLEYVDKSWITRDSIKTELDNFLPTGDNKYQVYVDGIPFECLFIKNKSYNGKNLFISMGGGGRKGKTYPCFYRWKYLNYLSGDYLAIDDPSYWKDPDVKTVCWYYGKDGKEYYNRIIKIVSRYKEIFGLSNSNLYFFGSSGGGTASINLANLFPGSTAIAFSPQFKLSTWNKDITERFRKSGVDLSSTEINGLNTDCTNPNSKYFIVENLASTRDYESQYRYFFTNHQFVPKIGIYTIAKNIWVWNHFSPSEPYPSHSANPEKLEIQVIQSILDGNIDVNCKVGNKNLGWYFSEVLSDKWIAHSNYLKLLEQYNSISTNKAVPHNYLVKIAEKIISKFVFLNKFKIDESRPRIKILIDEFKENIYFEISEISGEYWVRLIIKNPTINQINNISKLQWPTKIKFVDKNNSENFIYLRQEFNIYSPKDDIEEFIWYVWSYLNRIC